MIEKLKNDGNFFKRKKTGYAYITRRRFLWMKNDNAINIEVIRSNDKEKMIFKDLLLVENDENSHGIDQEAEAKTNFLDPRRRTSSCEN